MPRLGLATTLSPALTTRKTLDLSPVMTPGQDGERSSVAQYACSNKSKHAALTSQGPRERQSPRSSQTSSLCHAAQTRQHRPAGTTNTEPTIQIRSDKTWVRSHPLRDGIHDESLDLEAIQTDGNHDLSDWGHGPQLLQSIRRSTT